KRPSHLHVQTGGAHMLAFGQAHARPGEILFPGVLDGSLCSCSVGRESKIWLAATSVFTSPGFKNSLIPFTEGTQFPFLPSTRRPTWASVPGPKWRYHSKWVSDT